MILVPAHALQPAMVAEVLRPWRTQDINATLIIRLHSHAIGRPRAVLFCEGSRPGKPGGWSRIFDYPGSG